MISYLVDTNYVLRYLLDDVPFQADIVENYFRKAKRGEIQMTVPLLVFVEVDFNLSQLYRFDKAKIVDIIYSLVKLPYLDIEKYKLLVESLLAYSRNSISFVDALFLTEARQTGKQLLTFDKKLKKIS